MDVESPSEANEERADADTNVNVSHDPNYCDPCQLFGKSCVALNYCNDCEEKLCEACVKSHATRKATSSHKPVPLQDMKKADTFLCSPCSDDNKEMTAVTFCRECKEYLCEGCTNSHKNRKATRQHIPVALELLTEQSTQSDELLPSCQPCKDMGRNDRASKYCKDCDEYLCDICTRNHAKRNATKSHSPVPVSTQRQQEEDDSKTEDIMLCDPCISLNRNEVAKSFCQECEELLCCDCIKKHRLNKLTKTHILKSSESVEYVTTYCDICDDKTTKAVMFCKTCEEALCEHCGAKHKKQKITRDHTIESVKSKTLRQKIICDPCQEINEVKRAETFCKQCKEYLCESCTRHHRVQKISKAHELANPESAICVTGRLCEICADNELQVNASEYCVECSEALCNDCVRRHKIQKLTKGHEIVPVNDAPKPDRKVCEQCEEGDEAVKYCADCEEYLCADCCKTHKRTKSSANHTLKELGDIKKSDRKDCDSCNTPRNAESYCDSCEEFYCRTCSKQHRSLKATRDHNLVSLEDIGHEKDVRSPVEEDSKKFRSPETVIKEDRIPETAREGADRPGKPTSSDVRADSITISWDPPSKYGDDDYYQISYKDLDHEKKWKFFQGEFKSASAVLTDLKSNTAFIFRVRVVYENGEGPYSEESDKILTTDSPASRVVQFSQVKQKGNPSPTQYALPVTEVRVARNEKAKTKKFELGSPPHQQGKSKTIMLVGATGTGKSTLVDGIVNYALGVNWDDPFRFTVIDLEQEEKDREKNQALSQTEWITCYTLNPEKGSRLQYQLHIIDTPGFGDTRGLKRDQEIVEQIRQLFSEKEPRGVTFIDAVCFLIKAPDARLTAVQSYIFQSVMSLFGKDIEKNICSLITFADGIDPPVLAALTESGLPFGNSFTFNNSGLFAKNVNVGTASLSPMFWDMGLKSFRAFFDHLEQIETKSLQLTKDVLDERSRLEATVRNLQPQLDAGLLKVNCFKQEIRIIEENKSLIKDNKDFEYEVDETRQKKKELPRGINVTNCTHCHFTCHENCGYANDDEKANCCAMDSNGSCKICPDKCHWKKHANTPYIFEYVNVKVKKTYGDMQKKYKEATGKLLSQEQIIEKLGEELDELLDDIEDMMVIIKSCNERLEEIALRPNPLSMTEHIDLMIENEKLEKKDGFLQRINILNDFRKRAQISTEFESFRKEAQSTLRTAGKKRNRDPKSLLSRVGAWFKNPFS